MDFGWLLDRFVIDFGPKLGGQVGAKLAPKSEEMGYQDDVKKSSKIWRRDGPQVVRIGRVSRPLKNPSGILKY